MAAQKQQMAQAQTAAKKFMQQHKLDPETMAAIGEMAEAAIQNKNQYPALRNALLPTNILTEKELPEQVNYMTLTTLATLGKLAGGM